MYSYIKQLLLLAWIIIQVAFSSPTNPDLTPNEELLLGQHAIYKPTLSDLQHTAIEIIGIMKTVDSGALGGRKILIIGGTALLKKLPNGRKTMDLDFMIEGGNPTVKSIKEKTAKTSPQKFSVGVGGSMFELGPGKNINVDMIDSAMEEVQPNGMRSINAIDTINDLPFMSSTDLVFSKLISCPQRSVPYKKTQDAKDALDIVRSTDAVHLSQQQKSVLQRHDVLDEVAKQTGTTKQWWQQRLGL